MKTIEEEALSRSTQKWCCHYHCAKRIYSTCEKHGNTCKESKHSYNDFKAGVEFAQRWIDVDDELPEANKEEKGILYSEYILIKVRGYEHPFIGYYVKACDDEFFDFAPEILLSIKQIDITHWRAIDYKENNQN